MAMRIALSAGASGAAWSQIPAFYFSRWLVVSHRLFQPPRLIKSDPWTSTVFVIRGASLKWFFSLASGKFERAKRGGLQSEWKHGIMSALLVRRGLRVHCHRYTVANRKVALLLLMSALVTAVQPIQPETKGGEEGAGSHICHCR